MNRTLLLIAFAAIMGAGLVAVALDPGAKRHETPQSPPSVAPAQDLDPEVAVDVETDLASVAEEREFNPVTDQGPSKSWEVVALNEVGQPLPEAKITATRVGSDLQAVGRERWESVASGPWSLTVEMDGYPTWRRDVILESDKRLRTVARLGENLRITGAVQDEFGQTVTGMPVYFLPKGVRHPSSRDFVRDPLDPRAQPKSRSGVVTAELLAGGRIKATLPGAGEWRVSVGRPGDARWTEPVAQTLTHGGQEKVEITIPSLGQVRVEFPQQREDRPRQVSLHVFDPEHAAAVLRTRQQGVSDQQMYEEQTGGMSRSGDEAPSGEALAKMREKEAQKQLASSLGTAKPIKMEMNNSVKGVREMAGKTPTRAPAFEPGWRMIKSARPDENGVAQLKGLPLDTQMRFLFVRGKEQITTPTPFLLRDAKPRLGVPSLPPVATTLPSGPDNRATVALQLSPVETGPAKELGVRWKY
ncbi:carboxypeptidase-like regulatory domain-containing protein [Planctomycetota bacterium]|nr:carboxypeptidase-like regulatory domain-containing protein [Planctomycetota bacterium]